jgi:uncharacterized protein (TIGR02147 family)
MVQMDQSKDPEGKRHLLAELTGYSKSKARVLGGEALEFYSKWHNASVRAFFGIDQKENNPAVIGRRIFPEMPPAKVEETIRLLLSLGLISKTANGYALRDRNIAAEPDAREAAGRLRIQEMLKLAAEVFPHVPSADRDFSALTVYVSREGYQAIRDRIRAFRDEVKAVVDSDKEEDRIYTLALQFFPNTQLPEWDTGRKKP